MGRIRYSNPTQGYGDTCLADVAATALARINYAGNYVLTFDLKGLLLLWVPKD